MSEMSYTEYRKALRFGKRLVSGIGLIFVSIGVIIYYASSIEFINSKIFEAAAVAALLGVPLALLIMPDVFVNFIFNIKKSIEVYRMAREMKKIIDQAKRDHVWGWH